MKIIVTGRSVSWNAIYASKSYWIRKAFADQIHEQVRGALLEMGLRAQKKEQFYKEKVDIDIKAYFRSRVFDSDNIPAKLYIDGLKMYLIPDDTNKYVGSVKTESFYDKTGTERVEITIIPREGGDNNE